VTPVLFMWYAAFEDRGDIWHIFVGGMTGLLAGLLWPVLVVAGLVRLMARAMGR
jgi:hypothetical protein